MPSSISVTPRSRALVVVNPNNPTGSYLSPADRALVRAVCRRHGLALIADEVFLRYALDDEARGRSVVGRMEGVLTFGLGGLSKEVGLPQLKLAWIVVDGPLRAGGARASRARLRQRCVPLGRSPGAARGGPASRGGRRGGADHRGTRPAQPRRAPPTGSRSIRPTLCSASTEGGTLSCRCRLRDPKRPWSST